MSTSLIYLSWTFCPYFVSEKKWRSCHPAAEPQSHQVLSTLQKMACFARFAFQVILWVSPIAWSATVRSYTVGRQSIAHCSSCVGHRAGPAEIAWTSWKHTHWEKMFLNLCSSSFENTECSGCWANNLQIALWWHPGMYRVTFCTTKH